MKITDIIRKKKNKEELTKEEIKFFVDGYTKGEIPDYQVSSLLMAIYFNSMNKEEINNLTKAFIESGDVIDLSDISGIKVDKHSTGGVGDKISLIVLPLVSSLGVPIAKLSGKGLGHTGGTIDKLEAIEGFSTSLSLEKFKDSVKKYKVAIAGQTANLTPADKKFYALRDVTETVDSIPLIASSIMSKKLASGSDAIVLDVKTGEGAFMKTTEKSINLAKTMVDIGNSMGKKTIAVITDMNEPLGYEIGNANEVKEAIKVLNGEKITGLYDVAVEIAAYMVLLGQKANSLNEAKEMVIKALDSKKALEQFKILIENQGGNGEVVYNPDLLVEATQRFEIKATREGYLNSIKAMEIGLSAMYLGAGRQNKESKLDYGAGIELKKLCGDYVKKGETLCVLKHNLDNIDDAIKKAKEAFIINDTKLNKSSYIIEVVQ